MPGVVRLLTLATLNVLLVLPAFAANLRVMRAGLGSGTVTGSGINCGATCDATPPTGSVVTLTATAGAGSTFSKWFGDCTGTTATCNVTMSSDRSVRAEFVPSTPLVPLTAAQLNPTGIAAYLSAHSEVNTPARFMAVLPVEFRDNWIMMSRSESFQTGIAEAPRFLVPSTDAKNVFTFGLMTHLSYPGANPNAIEYMQWDGDPSVMNFRFHEIVLAPIPQMGTVSPRTRGVLADDARCTKCHSTRNIHNASALPGTDGIPPGTVRVKNKPNWDTYDSWGGMLPFNRDRIYQGTVEAAAFRKLLNPWTWRANDDLRAFIELLHLQPAGVPPTHAITRLEAGPNDGHIVFAFDSSPPVFTEPPPSTTSSSAVNYTFNGMAGTGPSTTVGRGGAFITLHHTFDVSNDEGRGVHMFDLLGGLGPDHLNQHRIADEIATHQFATGSVPVDVRPIALAIVHNPPCVRVNSGANAVESTVARPLNIDQSFFTARNGKSINQLVSDTALRAHSFPRRKADIQRLNIDRLTDVYWYSPRDPGDPAAPPANGLIQIYGAQTSQSTSTTNDRLRQEVFRREQGAFSQDTITNAYIDREDYTNTEPVALFRFFLEPLGVSVDKWGLAVRGRSRTYTFADVFGTYVTTLRSDIDASLSTRPYPGLPAGSDCTAIIDAVNMSLAAAVLPPATATPTFTDVQRIFNKACIECHGGLGYPPFERYFSSDAVDFSENEAPPPGQQRFTRSYDKAVMLSSQIISRIGMSSENCPYGMMPCGGPPLSQTDILTLTRWVSGGTPSTVGDPHLTTVGGVNYDFQGAGEFVLLRDEGTELQVRQTPVQTDGPLGPNDYTGLTSCVSLNTAVAIRSGAHRITYQPRLNGEPDPKGLELRIDGKLVTVPDEGLVVGGTRISRTNVAAGIQILMPGQTEFIVTPGWWDYYKVWYLNIDVRRSRATMGIMGSIAPGNWLPALPDGAQLGPMPRGLHERYAVLYGKFGNAWRVDARATLFDYAPGTSTNTFTMASWPGDGTPTCRAKIFTGPLAQPPLPPIAAEKATQLCAGVADRKRHENCLQDVMVTGEAGFATTYLAGEKLRVNRAPADLALLFPEDFKIHVNPAAISLGWKRTSDPEGRKVTYYQCVWELGTDFSWSNCKVIPPPLMPVREQWFLPLNVLLFIVGLGLLFLFLKLTRYRMWVRIVDLILIIAVIVLIVLAWLGRQTPTIARDVAGIQPGHSYYWRIIARDADGRTTESETRRFSTK